MPTRYRLPNGLTVIFEPLRTARVAAFQVWVNVGSADETPEEVGLAHLHEHMLFKGTARRGLGEIARGIEAHGGEVNAFTSFDHTVYHVVMASQHARYGLDVLADAVRNSAFDAGELSREIEVVCEEIKRSLDMPGRRASKDLFAATYQSHPYGRPVIGFEKNVRAHSRDTVVRFFDRHYHPANMVLVAVGDLDEPALRQWVDELFGGAWGRSTHLRGPRVAEAPSTTRRVSLTRDAVTEAHLHLAFAAGSMSHPDTPALDVLAMIAGQGDTSHLVRRVRRERMLVKDINAWSWTPRDPGLFAVSMTAGAQTLADAITETARVLRQLAHFEITDDELATVKGLFDAEQHYQRENMQGIARRLGSFETTAGGFEVDAQVKAKIAALTTADIQRVAKETLRFDRIVVSGLLPNDCGLTEAQVHQLLDTVLQEPVAPLARPPGLQRAVATPVTQGTTARPTRELRQLTLPSGATLLLKEERTVPLFSMRATFRGGLLSETAKTNGISSMVSRVMTRGAGTMGAEDISQRIDALAGSLSAVAGRSSFTLRGDFLSKHFDTAFGLFTEVLQSPTFAAAELEREQRLVLQELTSREDRPATVALELFARTMFGAHPYGLSSLGSREAVTALSSDALHTWRRTFLHPSLMTLAIVGDIDADAVEARVRAQFTERERVASPLKPMAQEPIRAPRVAAQSLQKAQSHLVIGFPSVSVTDPRRRPMELISTILSGQSGRLFLELRDKQSLAYSVSSMTVEGTDPGYFAVYMATSPEKVSQAIDGIRAQLQRLCDQTVSDDELSRAREYLIGTHEIGLQRTSARTSTIALNSSYGLGPLHHLDYAKEISAITPADLLTTARAIIDFNRSVSVLVGPQATEVNLSR